MSTDPGWRVRSAGAGCAARTKDTFRDGQRVPLTGTEVEVSKRPPSDPPEKHGVGLSADDVE
jgi:hypothetical protein